VIHYHGLPITPAIAAARAISGGHAFISFRNPEQLSLALELVQTFACDNGAFSAWRDGAPIKSWKKYYEWIEELKRHPAFDFAVIPDVIDGDEADNDALLAEWPHGTITGAPVWHLHESLERLDRLSAWPRLCLGSSGKFSTIGTTEWWSRMAQAMEVVCDKAGRPRCKLHGLRMLDPQVFTEFPFASVDSTNIGRNVGLDSRWTGPYSPASKDARALVIRERIEAYQSPGTWRERISIQDSFF
jgi:hypothetical protein